MGKNAQLVCFDCGVRVGARQARYLTLEERLWGRCYQNGGCWEFGEQKADGRPRYIMADGRQVPPSHVALFLSGSARPSPLHVVEHPTCHNAMCVRPEHLRWVAQAAARGPMWAHLMTQDQLAHYHELKRANKTRHQRNYRQRLRAAGGAPSVRSARQLRDESEAREALRKNRELTPLVPLAAPPPVEGWDKRTAPGGVAAPVPAVPDFEPEPQPPAVEPQPEPIPAPVAIEAPAVKPAPALGLLASLAGARIADPD